jgi:hypothetical protein
MEFFKIETGYSGLFSVGQEQNICQIKRPYHYFPHHHHHHHFNPFDRPDFILTSPALLSIVVVVSLITLFHTGGK